MLARVINLSNKGIRLCFENFKGQNLGQRVTVEFLGLSGLYVQAKLRSTEVVGKRVEAGFQFGQPTRNGQSRLSSLLEREKVQQDLKFRARAFEKKQGALKIRIVTVPGIQ